MQALIVIDVQNEFSPSGKRPVAGHAAALQAIQAQVNKARQLDLPIAWIRHFNRPDESPAFVPGTPGSAFSPGFGPLQNRVKEKEFHKDVYGAFTGTNIQEWLTQFQVNEILLAGFYTHGCVSTTAREAIMRNYTVVIDPAATSTCDLQEATLGHMPAAEVKRGTLLQLANMGAVIRLMPAVVMQ